MCEMIAALRRQIPEELLRRRKLEGRIRQRTAEAEQELWFSSRERWPYLPVWHEGQLLIWPWGNRRPGSALPRGGHCEEEELQYGTWASLEPEPVEILATYACAGGFWYAVPEGIRGILVRDRDRRPHVYMRTRPSTVYYRNMTRSVREPVFLGKQI